MHTAMVNGNRLVELNLTSKRNSGWVGGFYYLHRSRCVVIVLCDTPAGSAGGSSRDDASWPEPNTHLDAKILVLPKNPGSMLQRAGGQGQWLRDLRASGSHLKSSLSITGWSMVTLKNIDSATHESWRYPTKHVFPESVFWGILHLASAKCTLLMPNAHFDGNW